MTNDEEAIAVIKGAIRILEKWDHSRGPWSFAGVLRQAANGACDSLSLPGEAYRNAVIMLENLNPLSLSDIISWTKRSTREQVIKYLQGAVTTYSERKKIASDLLQSIGISVEPGAMDQITRKDALAQAVKWTVELERLFGNVDNDLDQVTFDRIATLVMAWCSLAQGLKTIDSDPKPRQDAEPQPERVLRDLVGAVRDLRTPPSRSDNTVTISKAEYEELVRCRTRILESRIHHADDGRPDL